MNDYTNTNSCLKINTDFVKFFFVLSDSTNIFYYQFPGNVGNALTFVFSPGRITAANPLRIQRT